MPAARSQSAQGMQPQAAGQASGQTDCSGHFCCCEARPAIRSECVVSFPRLMVSLCMIFMVKTVFALRSLQIVAVALHAGET